MCRAFVVRDCHIYWVEIVVLCSVFIPAQYLVDCAGEGDLAVGVDLEVARVASYEPVCQRVAVVVGGRHRKAHLRAHSRIPLEVTVNGTNSVFSKEGRLLVDGGISDLDGHRHNGVDSLGGVGVAVAVPVVLDPHHHAVGLRGALMVEHRPGADPYLSGVGIDRELRPVTGGQQAVGQRVSVVVGGHHRRTHRQTLRSVLIHAHRHRRRSETGRIVDVEHLDGHRHRGVVDLRGGGVVVAVHVVLDPHHHAVGLRAALIVQNRGGSDPDLAGVAIDRELRFVGAREAVDQPVSVVVGGLHRQAHRGFRLDVLIHAAHRGRPVEAGRLVVGVSDVDGHHDGVVDHAVRVARPVAAVAHLHRHRVGVLRRLIVQNSPGSDLDLAGVGIDRELRPVTGGGQRVGEPIVEVCGPDRRTDFLALTGVLLHRALSPVPFGEGRHLVDDRHARAGHGRIREAEVIAAHAVRDGDRAGGGAGDGEGLGLVPVAGNPGRCRGESDLAGGDGGFARRAADRADGHVVGGLAV